MQLALKENRFRNYSPGTGRFISEDPIGFIGLDTNLYRYVQNGPLSKVDPSGKIVFTTGSAVLVGAVLGGIAGGTGAYLAGSDGYGILSGVVGGSVGGGLAVFLGAGAAIAKAGTVALGTALEGTSVTAALLGESIGFVVTQLLNFVDVKADEPLVEHAPVLQENNYRTYPSFYCVEKK